MGQVGVGRGDRPHPADIAGVRLQAEAPNQSRGEAEAPLGRRGPQSDGTEIAHIRQEARLK